MHNPAAPLNEHSARVPAQYMNATESLPIDWQQATLIGRAMTPEGPSVVYVNDKGRVIDITHSYATTSDLFEQENPVEAAKKAAISGKDLGSVQEIMTNSAMRDRSKAYLLSPVDYQEIEAAGVTFVASLIERMVENRVMSDPIFDEIRKRFEQQGMASIGAMDEDKKIPYLLKELGIKEAPEAATVESLSKDLAIKHAMNDPQVDVIRGTVRKEVADIVGTDDFSTIKPGSKEALDILERMKKEKMSTIYPQVGLGKLGELFSKASIGLSVGHGAQAGYSSDGKWTNPEPEVVLFGSSKGKIVGASVGNDVNDRYTEGLSPLYLHEAKVRNGSTVMGPFVRLFDDKFSMKDVREAEIHLQVMAADNKTVRFEGANNMAKISRDPEDIFKQAMGDSHYRPHGVAVFLGTMLVPQKDLQGETFTHKEGDITSVGSPKLGRVTNIMLPAEKVQDLETGPLALARNLAERGLLMPKTRGVSGVGLRGAVSKEHQRVAGDASWIMGV